MERYSKQRELILNSLKNRKDHPTAEMLYNDLVKEMPELGIATVYRNLAVLNEKGEVMKLKPKNGTDRYDGNVKPHIHFECEKCKTVSDIWPEENKTKQLDNEIMGLVETINGKAETTSIYITGLCNKCKDY